MRYKFNQIRDGRCLALYVNRYVYDEVLKGSMDQVEDLIFQGLYNSMDPTLNKNFESYFLTITHNHLDFITKDYMFPNDKEQAIWASKFMNLINMITNKCEMQFMRDFHDNIKSFGLQEKRATNISGTTIDDLLTKAIAEFHYDLFDSLRYQDFTF